MPSLSLFRMLVVLNLFSALFCFAQDSASKVQAKGYVVIEGVSAGTTLEIKLPHLKESKVVQVGEQLEIPSQWLGAGEYPIVIQMVKDGYDIDACQISVEQLKAFNRSYICGAQGLDARVHVRVYTNLHGPTFKSRETVARR